MIFKLCQINPIVGDLKDNSEKIISLIKASTNESPTELTVLIFPELAVSGYPPLDLLDNSHFISKQLEYVNKIVQATQGPNVVIFGYIEKNNGTGRNLYNSAIVCSGGKIIYNYRKRLLPTYDVFDEARYFESGKSMGFFNIKGKRVGLVICEDLWYDNKFYTINPAQELYNAHADMIISINASPSIVGKYRQKIEMVTSISKTYGLPIIYINQVGSTDDIVFDGNSFAVNENGVIVAHSERYNESILHVPVEALSRDTPIYCKGIPLWDPISLNSSYSFESDAQFFYEQAIYGIQEYIKKCGFKGVVIGESGGIDSAVVTALAADALGGKRVAGITMPSQYSSKGSYEDSEILCDNFGVVLYNYQIKDIYTAMLQQFNYIFPKSIPGLAEENLQARIRGQILMTFSNRYGYLVLSTGNKSELSVGYCTIHGDMAGGLAPISDLYKMEVYAVAKYINKLHGKEMIPQVIIDKEPSAELAPNQRDVDSLPPYPVLDALLKFFIEGEVLPKAEFLMCGAVTKEYPLDAARILKLINKAEFKRRQAAITIKMHQKAFGYGRRIPIAQKWIESV
jgi:NAD+ synthetase